LPAFLTAAAFAPLLVPLTKLVPGALIEAELTSVLNQFGGIGTGYLAALLTATAERLHHAEPRATDADDKDRVQAELAAAIQAALDAPGEAGSAMRAEVSAVLSRLDAVQAAMAADRDNILIPGFTQLGERVAEFSWMLSDVEIHLAEMRRALARQGAHQREQVIATRGSLDTITELLQQVIAAQHREDSPAGDPPPTDGAQPPCPYPGMRPFQSRDAKWFFGREELTRYLIDRLAEQANARRPLFVLGPSGAGKSSLLQAGLIPALRTGLLPISGSRRWPRLLVASPGPQPLTALARAASSSRPEVSTEEVLALLAREPSAAAAAFTELLLASSPPAGRRRADRLVIVIDQFEEIFTQCQDQAERQKFVRVLLALTGTAADAAGALVVIGVRADFYQDCSSITELSVLMPDNQLVVGPLAGNDLRRAITRPAAAVGCSVEAGLTELLLSDIALRRGSDGYEAGALPLLGYALRATWDRRDGRVLTVAGYREAGGIGGAVARQAERIYKDFPPATQAVTRRILLRLVNAGPGAQLTRRMVARDDLLTGLDASAAEACLARFTQARLITADADGAEITHEAFLSAWPRLAEWIAEDQAGLRLHRQIGQDARAWAQENRDQGGLYRGARLSNALAWRSRAGNDAELTALEREFVEASSAAEHAEEAAREAGRLRDRRQNRRLRALAAGLAVVLAVALVAAGLARHEQQQAVSQQSLAESGGFAARSDVDLTTNLSAADTDALAAWQADHTATSGSSLLSAESDPYLGSFPETHGYDVSAMAASPDGRLVAVSGQVGSQGGAVTNVQLWNVGAGRLLKPKLRLVRRVILCLRRGNGEPTRRMCRH
jgi:hypothetical protein